MKITRVNGGASVCFAKGEGAIEKSIDRTVTEKND